MPRNAGPARTASTTGTQSIERAARILRELGTRSRVGWGLTELAARCELDKGTTHRIVSGLLRERLVARHPKAARYVPGPLLFELSLGLDVHARLRDMGGDIAKRLARRHGGISAVTLASGFDAVCCAHFGKTSVRAFSFAVGDRRPMVMNSAGVAMLIHLQPSTQRAACTYGLDRVRHLGDERLRKIRAMVERSSQLGYGLNQDNTVAGITGVAVAVLDGNRQPVAAVSITGTTEQFPASKISALAEALREEAAVLSQALPMDPL